MHISKNVGLKIKSIFISLFFVSLGFAQSEMTLLNGNVISMEDVEGIHVLNTTSQKNTITNERGSFEIEAKLNDTIVFSALKYNEIKLVVNQKHLDNAYISVVLSERINVLDDILIGKILTGALDSDIDNSETNTIDLQKLGIPGYYGRQLTQPERRLADADHGKYISSFNGGPFGLGFGVNVNKILNKVSGRTKKLRHLVALDTEKNYIEKLKSQFSEQLFENHNLTEGQQNEFFFYCADDPEFTNLMKTQGDLAVVNFLYNKLESYRKIISLQND